MRQKRITNKIDFRFAKNWKTINQWHEARKAKGLVTTWSEQKHMIQTTFDATAPAVVNWSKLWVDVETWFQGIQQKRGRVLWQEQKREIESCMLRQIEDLNSDDFVLAYVDAQGRPRIMAENMNYWTALKVQRQLSGDGNGRGGNEDMDRITIVNLNNLIQ